VVLRGQDFLAVFLAVLFLAVDFLAGADFLAVVFFAGEVFFAVVFFAGEVFFAVDFFAADVFLAADELDFLAADFDVDFLAVEEPVLFLAGDEVELFLAVVVFAAPPVAVLAVLAAAERVSFGSFFAPETTFFRSAPGVNLGTFVALALIRSPVRGFRTIRALRAWRWKEPNPVMATFSPLATSRVMVSSTESSACWACLRLPSNRAERLSIN
jgi:hypothetical protein